MTKVTVIGAAGRMGKMIVTACSKDSQVKITGATEISGSSFIGRDVGETAGIEKNGTLISDSLEKAILESDVVIDFTFPETTIENLKVCEKFGKKMVIGSTGLKPEHYEAIKTASKKIAIVQSPNMSVGVNLLFRLVADVAKVLNDYDIEIIEAHHHFKKDAPSGTALKIAEVIAESLGRDLNKVGNYGRKGITGERPKDEIGIHSVRAGDIVGDHTVLFCTDGERIELKHQAHSRMTFVMGAVKAAKFLSSQSAGLFTMKEVLGL